MIRIVIADDQAMLCNAFAALLDLEADLEVVGQASTVAEVTRLVNLERPDVVMMDVQMPADGTVRDGIDATAVLRRQAPESKVIIVTTFGRPGYLRRAMEAGAVGFMVKDAPADHLIEGIRRVVQGLRVVDPELAASSLTVGASPLTDREAEVLQAAGSGGSTADIAKRVFLSEGTVRNHLSAAKPGLTPSSCPGTACHWSLDRRRRPERSVCRSVSKTPALSTVWVTTVTSGTSRRANRGVLRSPAPAQRPAR